MRFTAALISVLCFCFALTAAPPMPRPAPEILFTVPSQGLRKLSDYLGKVVAIEFIYTTCAPCTSAAQDMQKLQTDFGPQGFQAIVVAFNPNAEVLIDDFINSSHLTLPVGWTLGSHVTSFMGYGPADRFVVPQIALIDQTGLIRHQTQAQGDDSARGGPTLRQRIAEMLHPLRTVPKETAPARR